MTKPLNDPEMVDRACRWLTEERWERAKAVLSGDDPDGVSILAAARAAGVKVRTLKRWIERSRQRRLEDETWIYEIAEVADDAKELQTAKLRDLAWNHATQGTEEPVFQGGELVGHKTKYDHKLLTQEIEARDPDYRPKPAPAMNVMLLDAGEVYKKLRAQQRLKQVGDELGE